MKRELRLAALATFASVHLHAQIGSETRDYSPFPTPDSGYVTDLDNLLTDDEEERIEIWLWQAESRTGIEIAVVTVASVSEFRGAPTGTIEEFARGLFDAWGIGNMPKNDGILLLVARLDRKVRIELGAGYGRDRDHDAGRIIQENILPYFRNDEYSEGITEGVRAIGAEFAYLRFGFPWNLAWMSGGILGGAFIGISLVRNGKKGWGWIILGLVIVLILFLIKSLREIARHMPDSHSSSWSAGGVGGGFGGGFSGGGGATGSW